MRALPVALAYPDEDRMLRQSARLSAMTHWDPQAEVCCAVYCLWIRALLQGTDLASAWRSALLAGRVAAARGSLSSDSTGPAPLPNGFWERLEAAEYLTYPDLQASGYAGYAVECLEAAVWCCLHANDVEHALVQAVNLAGEADTIAAVAGGAAGAAWGPEALPERWLEKLHQRERLVNTALRLSSLRRHLEIYSRADLPGFEFRAVAERIHSGRNPLSARDIEVLVAGGVTHILDLRESKEWLPPRFGLDALAAVEQHSIRRLNLPFRDARAPRPEDLDAACSFLDAALEQEGAAVYVHCRAGRERTAAVLVAWLARRNGFSYEDALAALRANHPGLKPLDEQENAVRKWLTGTDA